MPSINDRDIEDVRLGGPRTPQTIDPLAAILGGIAGGATILAIWITSVPIQALFLEGVVAGIVAGGINENSKVPAMDGAAAAIVGAVLGLIGICAWLVLSLSMSTGLELELFLSLLAPGIGVIILAGAMAAIPAAILASVLYRTRRNLGLIG